jgi:hypothetical protein
MVWPLRFSVMLALPSVRPFCPSQNRSPLRVVVAVSVSPQKAFVWISPAFVDT